MSNTRSKQGRDYSNVYKTIYNQGIERMSGYCANGPMGVISTMSKTRSNIGSEGKWWDCSNMSKTIENQGIKGSLEYCAKGPIRVSSPMSKTRSKQDIEGKLGIVPMFFKPLRSNTLEEVWGMSLVGK